jgi:hypothetical protein
MRSFCMTKGINSQIMDNSDADKHAEVIEASSCRPGRNNGNEREIPIYDTVTSITTSLANNSLDTDYLHISATTIPKRELCGRVA